MSDLAIRLGMSHEAIATRVCTAFDRRGLSIVLVGGACVEIHAHVGLASRDADFVCQFVGQSAKEKAILTSLGFHPSGSRSVYGHEEIPDFSVDLVSAPIMIGERRVPDSDLLIKQDGELILRILGPLDTFCDRLACYLHHNDEESLVRAVAVDEVHGLDRTAIAEWLRHESAPDTRMDRVRRRFGLI